MLLMVMSLDRKPRWLNLHWDARYTVGQYI